MKHIIKNNPPESLIEDKKLITAFNDLGQQARKDIQNSLLEEQGYICAYCMQRVSMDWNKDMNKPKIEIEHYLSQELHPDKALNYENMLGVCNGGIYRETENQKINDKFAHCDKTKNGKVDGKIVLQILNPLDKNKSGKLISYQNDGKIVSNNQNSDSDVENDINIVLNLNNRNLCKYRELALDFVYEKFKKKYEDKKQWTKAIFQKEIESLKTKNKEGKYKEYVSFLIWFFEKKQKSYK